MQKIIWVNRYSDTMIPDIHERWKRIMYVNKIQFAGIHQFKLGNKLFLQVNLYFPTLQNDTKYNFKSFLIKDYEKAKLWCEKEFLKFQKKLQ
jgi:hypothetical protein